MRRPEIYAKGEDIGCKPGVVYSCWAPCTNCDGDGCPECDPYGPGGGMVPCDPADVEFAVEVSADDHQA